MRVIKKAMMKIARSSLGGALASFCIRRCLSLLPIQVEAASDEFVMMRHPQPMASCHAILVPRKRVPDIETLLESGDSWVAFAAFVENQVDFKALSLCCNFGARQEVKQVHFHLLPREALAQKAGEETECHKIGERSVWLSTRGNVYMDSGDLACEEYVRKAFALGKERFPKGFSLIWR